MIKENKNIIKIESKFDYETIFDFNLLNVSKKIMDNILMEENIPNVGFFVYITLVKNNTIKKINNEQRNINKITDVLSFPNIDFKKPSDFSKIINKKTNKILDLSIYDMELEKVFLGDIIINVDRIKLQSKKYGHSEKREFSFLVAHSIFHLLGYDHINEEDEKIMFSKQENILNKLKICR